MTPPEPISINHPSKRNILLAGEVLRKLGDGDISLVDKDQAMRVLSDWRQLHYYPINTFQAYFRTIVKKHYPTAIVAQRLKRMPSIINKLKRFPDMQLNRMQDICGFRIVVKSIADVYSLHARFAKSKRFKHELILPPKDYIQQPKSDGYRSLHQIFKYSNTNHPELNKLRIELQIRTMLQHYWATAVETLGFIEKSSFKTGEGSDEMKRFFQLSSALFAKEEKCSAASEFDDLAALKAELSELERTLHICQKLTGLARSAKHIEHAFKDSDEYHLMELDMKRGSIILQPFAKSQLADAEALYQIKEDRTRDNPDISIVLISAGNIKQIKKAYPNYFLDTKNFTAKLQGLLQG